MQVAALNPRYVSADDIPAEALAAGEQKIGDRGKFVEQVALLSQPFIKDPKRTIQDLVKEQIGKLGENIVIRRFVRFELGALDEDSSQGS